MMTPTKTRRVLKPRLSSTSSIRRSVSTSTSLSVYLYIAFYRRYRRVLAHRPTYRPWQSFANHNAYKLASRFSKQVVVRRRSLSSLSVVARPAPYATAEMVNQASSTRAWRNWSLLSWSRSKSKAFLMKSVWTKRANQSWILSKSSSWKRE